MAVGRHERGEEAPRAPRDQPQRAALVGRQRRCRGLDEPGRLAQRAIAGASAQSASNGTHRGPLRGVPQRQERGGRHREQHSAGHAPVVSRQRARNARRREFRGLPLEHAAAHEVQTSERARDRIGHQLRLVRHDRDRQRHLPDGGAKVTRDRANVAPLRYSRSRGPQPRQRRKHRGHDDDRHDERRPERRRTNPASSIRPGA